jgi:hypothetical protein
MPSLNTGNAILSNAIAVDSSYNVGIGGAASGSFKLQVTGTTNLTGALTGTSATFTANANGVVLNAATGTTNTQFKVANTSGDNYSGVAASDGSSVFSGTTAYSAYLGTNVGRSLHFATNGVVRQTIDLNGASTFLSSVTATGNAIGTFTAIGSAALGAGGNIRLNDTATTNSRDWAIGNAIGAGDYGDLVFINGTSQGATPSSTKMIIKSGGNVGIGTNTVDRLTISRNAADNSGGLTLYNENTSGYGSAINFRVNYAGVYNTSRIHGDWDTGNSGALHFFTANTSQTLVERMTILGSGNIGIGLGSTTPLGLLSLRAQVTDTPTIVFQNTSGGPSSAIANFTSAVQTFTTIGANAFVNSVGSISRFNTSYASCFIALDEGDIGFSTNTSAANPAQRMRILAGGAVLINSGSVVGSDSRFNVHGPNAGPTFSNDTSGQQNLLCWNKGNTGDNLWIEFHVGSTLATRGSIDYNRASNLTRYNTSSDANLKNIIGDSNLEKSVEILSTTKIREYSWKEDETNKPQIGVIAQELYETYKGAVSVGSDESLLGTEEYKSWKVDKTAFTFHLIAGWQKHEQKINELQAQIEAQQKQINSLINR